MSTEFRVCIRVAATHSYFDGGPCPHVAFVIPSDTQRLLRRGRMLARKTAGALTLLVPFEDDEPVVQLIGARLRFGVRVVDSQFANYTALGYDPREVTPVHVGVVGADELALQGNTRLVGSLFAWPLSEPATVELRDAADRLVWAESITDARPTASIDLRRGRPGRHTLELRPLDPMKPPQTTALYLDPELVEQRVLGVVEIELSESIYAGAHAWTLPFLARTDVLHYYVVAVGHTDTDIDELAVTDTSAEKLTFTKVSPPDHDEHDQTAQALIAAGGQVVAFHANASVPRRARPSLALQLSRGELVLAPKLPQPGPEQVTTDVILHLNKPKP